MVYSVCSYSVKKNAQNSSNQQAIKNWFIGFYFIRKLFPNVNKTNKKHNQHTSDLQFKIFHKKILVYIVFFVNNKHFVIF